jgi:hypothetical protein
VRARAVAVAHGRVLKLCDRVVVPRLGVVRPLQVSEALELPRPLLRNMLCLSLGWVPVNDVLVDDQSVTHATDDTCC